MTNLITPSITSKLSSISNFPDSPPDNESSHSEQEEADKYSTWTVLGELLQEQLVLGQTLDWFEKVGGERQLMAEVSLAGLNERIIFSQVFQDMLGSLHILAVSAMEACNVSLPLRRRIIK